MANYEVPGQDEYVAGPERVALPGGEDYKATILEITEASKPNFDGVIQDVLVVKFDVTSFADDGPLEDLDGKPVENGSRWVWKDIDPKRLGFKTSGEPSIARQFFAAANGVADVTQRIEQGSTDDLIGRQLVISLIVYISPKDGKKKNKITAFKTPSRRRGQAAPAPAAVRAPAVSDEYAAAVASLVEGVDVASPEVLAETKAKLAAAA